MEACSDSKQVSLQGLDYIATEGAEAFDQLKSIVNVLQDNGVDVTWANSIKQDLKAGKRYLKTDYKTHTGAKRDVKITVPRFRSVIRIIVTTLVNANMSINYSVMNVHGSLVLLKKSMRS